MGRGLKRGGERGTWRKVQSKVEGSEESDEDYTVRGDEDFEDSDEYNSFLAGDKLEENLDEYEDEDEVVVSKVVTSKGQKGSSSRNQTGVGKPQSRKRVKREEDDEDDDEESKPDEIICLDDEDDDEEFKPDEIIRLDDEDYDDEEFMTDEIECVDDEDEMETKKNRKLGRPPFQEEGLPEGRKRKGKTNRESSKAVKNPIRKKTKRHQGLGMTSKKKSVSMARSNKGSGQPRKVMAHSDSDFESSEPSDCEYTISEEEREQIREASELCRYLATTNTSSSSSANNVWEEKQVVRQQRSCPGRKDKGKIEDLKNEVGKQVCGVCLSEEEKKTVRGTLDCCNHYFCFVCIMEWSRVESRCPLCKQRFTTISKPARSDTGFELRTTVIQVTERDQVYQVSEEELRRGFLGLHENEICTECQQGGDDALMLLCDLCDSPAHTYCVGLGYEVPEGNWYCAECRPIVSSSVTPHAPNPTPNQSASTTSIDSSSQAVNVGEDLDLNAMYVPDLPLTQETDSLPSPGHSVGNFESRAYPLSERRRIQNEIRDRLYSRITMLSFDNLRMSIASGNQFSGSLTNGESELVLRPSMASERAVPHRTLTSNLLGQAIQGSASTSTVASSVNRMLPPEHSGANMGIESQSVHGLHPCNSRPSFGPASAESSQIPLGKEQVQSMVRNHLRSLSKDVQIGYNSFKDIARSSTHTILAACGLEHRPNEVRHVQPPSVCEHVEEEIAAAGGQKSLMKGQCSSCFNSFVNSVVRESFEKRVHPWFRG